MLTSTPSGKKNIDIHSLTTVTNTMITEENGGSATADALSTVTSSIDALKMESGLQCTK